MTETKTCHPDLVRALMEKIGDDRFTVVFIKKDGSERKMVGQRGVADGLKGGKSTIKDHTNLIGIYEDGKGYRCFDEKRVVELRGAGHVLRVL